MNHVHMLKSEIRSKYLSERVRMSQKSQAVASRTLCRLIADEVRTLEIHSIFLYFSFRGEPDLMHLMELCPDVEFSFPVVGETDGEMEFYAWRQGGRVVANKFGICEPAVQISSVSSIPCAGTLIVAPSICLDQYGYRLGYGGGFYDRFIYAYPESITMGVCYAEFLVGELPSDPWDRPLDMTCTQGILCKI